MTESSKSQQSSKVELEIKERNRAKRAITKIFKNLQDLRIPANQLRKLNADFYKDISEKITPDGMPTTKVNIYALYQLVQYTKARYRKRGQRLLKTFKSDFKGWSITQ